MKNKKNSINYICVNITKIIKPKEKRIIPCTKCDKNISRNNMKRHERLKHPADQIQEEQIQEE